ncbi:Glucose-6-phosphate 1-dehydrogenase [Dissostichus eleginoides]|uniref:Glucose-6-phosphate 1-dehydrogenase n=1 Tax=Dissostichus eleginoides TaxID=100907 RepID=A0AAD9FFW6_DISEL|nr:Glucose-6-phosphate 1-dehydrogenase [Dissostichus eleginoides]
MATWRPARIPADLSRDMILNGWDEEPIGGIDSESDISDVEDPDYCPPGHVRPSGNQPAPAEQDQSDTEESSESSEEEMDIVSNRMSRKGSYWAELPPTQAKTPSHNLLRRSEKNWDVPIRVLFGSPLHNPMYKATMSIGRFEDIRRLLRFDDKRTRASRLETDHMTAFRYIWDLFLVNCRQKFIPSDCVTVDEQLVPFRGRTKFLVVYAKQACQVRHKDILGL